MLRVLANPHNKGSLSVSIAYFWHHGAVKCVSPGFYTDIFTLSKVNRRVEEHITHADMTASDVANSWQLIAEEGEMKVYKRELEENGMVVDPVKAIHTVRVRELYW